MRTTRKMMWKGIKMIAACGVYVEWIDGANKSYTCEGAEVKDNMLIIRYSENQFNTVLYVPITQSIRDIKIKK